MTVKNIFLSASIAVFAITAFTESSSVVNVPDASRAFTIDYENNEFLMDGKPFRYISGSFHYFRAMPERWADKLRAMRAAGLNAVST